MSKSKALPLCKRPNADFVFIDSSAIIYLLATAPANAMEREKAEAYSHFFSKLLPMWEILGYVNPLVMVEVANKIDSLSLKGLVPQLGNPKEIREEITKHPALYSEQIAAYHTRSEAMLDEILGVLAGAECILCESFPDDDIFYTRTRDAFQSLRSPVTQGISPADAFHYEFMKHNGLTVAISGDAHFERLPGVTVHRHLQKPKRLAKRTKVKKK